MTQRIFIDFVNHPRIIHNLFVLRNSLEPTRRLNVHIIGEFRDIYGIYNIQLKLLIRLDEANTRLKLNFACAYPRIRFYTKKHFILHRPHLDKGEGFYFVFHDSYN